MPITRQELYAIAEEVFETPVIEHRLQIDQTTTVNLLHMFGESILSVAPTATKSMFMMMKARHFNTPLYAAANILPDIVPLEYFRRSCAECEVGDSYIWRPLFGKAADAAVSNPVVYFRMHPLPDAPKMLRLVSTVHLSLLDLTEPQVFELAIQNLDERVVSQISYGPMR